MTLNDYHFVMARDPNPQWITVGQGLTVLEAGWGRD